MLTTAALTLLALMTAAVLAAAGSGSPAAIAHLAFAAGIVPLIFAAISHFVPVLTRTGDPSRRIRQLPFFAQFAGLTAAFALQGWLPYSAVFFAAAVDLLLALILLRWIFSRVKATLGSPHPGWRWYAGALIFFILALLAILASLAWPEHYGIWRLLHLHLNLLGLLGLAAFGTLPVLLPTVLGKPDLKAADWLRRRFWPTFTLTLLMAASSATALWLLAVVSAAWLLILLLSLILHWIRSFGLRHLLADGASCALMSASSGWLLCLLAGALHAFDWLPARPTLWAWAAAFLLPLVTGALSQLLPVWTYPGRISPQRQHLRSALAAGGQVRSVLFLLAGLLFLAGLAEAAIFLALAGLLGFVAGLRALRIDLSKK